MPYTADKYANFATSTIAGGASGLGTSLQISDLTVTVQSGDGAKFPSTFPFPVVMGTPTSGSGATEIAACTARSGDTLTLTRGQDGTTAKLWAVGTTITNDLTAGGVANLWTAINTGRPYNVLDYGAKGDGTTDDTSAIQAAITAAVTAGGGTVYFPPATYLISSTLTITSDNVELVGSGWASQLLAAGTFTATPMVQVQQPGGGAFRYGIRIAHLFLNGNHVTGVGGLDLVTTYAARVEHVRIRYCTGVGIHMDGTSGNVGAYNNISNCHVTDGGAGVGLQTDFSEWLTVTGGLFSFYNSTGGIAIKCSNLNCRFIGVGIDNCDTGIDLEFSGRAVIAGCQFDRGQTRFIYLRGTQANLIVGNSFNTYNGSAGTGILDVTDKANGGNIITGNAVRLSTTWPHFVYEHGSPSTGAPGNLYIGNYLDNLPCVLQTGIMRANPGYNPQESINPPLAPTVTNAGTGGTVAAGVYGTEITYVDDTGETTASANTNTTTTGSTSTITVSPPAQEGNAVAYYVYMTQVNGATYTRQQAAGSPTPLDQSFTITAPPTNTGATPPVSNTTAGVTTPSVPATGVSVINTTGVDVTAYITGGTVTAISVGNKATGLTSGAIRVPAYQSIAINYSVAPTWVWIGE